MLIFVSEKSAIPLAERYSLEQTMGGAGQGNIQLSGFRELKEWRIVLFYPLENICPTHSSLFMFCGYLSFVFLFCHAT